MFTIPSRAAMPKKSEPLQRVLLHRPGAVLWRHADPADPRLWKKSMETLENPWKIWTNPWKNHEKSMFFLTNPWKSEDVDGKLHGKSIATFDYRRGTGV